MFQVDSSVWQKRAYNGKIWFIRKKEAENLYFTPLGEFSPSVIEYLVDSNIIQQWEDSYYVWVPGSGKDNWQRLKNLVYQSFIKGNPTFQTHKHFWSNIDYILSAMNKRYTFVSKDFIQISEVNKICDNLIVTDKDKEELETYEKWKMLENT